MSKLAAFRFNSSQVEWKPSATNSAKTRSLAGAYVDVRHIQSALDELATGWSSTVTLERSNGEYYATVHIRIGEALRGDTGNGAMPADAMNQAFRRAACSHGLGRYLWLSESQWEEYDESAKRFTPAALERLSASMKPLPKGKFVRMHELGRKAFENWNHARHHNCSCLTDGRTSSSKHLTEHELDRMIAGLEELIATQTPQLNGADHS